MGDGMKFANETAFTDAVIDLAMRTSHVVHHDRMKQNVQGLQGFPDLVIVGRGGVLYRELKMPGKDLDPKLHQTTWAAALLVAGADYKIWRPDDWNEIVETLTGRRP